MVGFEGQRSELFVGNLDTVRVVAVVSCGFDCEPGLGGGADDEADDDVGADEGPAPQFILI